MKTNFQYFYYTLIKVLNEEKLLSYRYDFTLLN